MRAVDCLSIRSCVLRIRCGWTRSCAAGLCCFKAVGFGVHFGGGDFEEITAVLSKMLAGAVVDVC